MTTRSLRAATRYALTGETSDAPQLEVVVLKPENGSVGISLREESTAGVLSFMRKRIVIADVSGGSAADIAGLIVTDRIVKVNDTVIGSVQMGLNMVGALRAGPIKFTIERDPGVLSLEFHKSAADEPTGIFLTQWHPLGHAVVTRVDRHLPGHTCGLLADDRILVINGETVDGGSHAEALLSSSVGATTLKVRRSRSVANNSESMIVMEELLAESQATRRRELELAAKCQQLERLLQLWELSPETLERTSKDELQEFEERLSGKLRVLRDAIDNKRAASLAGECSICMERPKMTVFNCGHRACETCAAQLRHCHICRVPLTIRVRMYDC